MTTPQRLQGRAFRELVPSSLSMSCTSPLAREQVESQNAGVTDCSSVLSTGFTLCLRASREEHASVRVR